VSRTLVLDTTVFSSLLRKTPEVEKRWLDELRSGATVLVSPIVYYELRRGLLKRDAHRLLAFLDELVAKLVWIEVTRRDWEEAADLWVATQKSGRPRSDADLLIAAQAKRRGAVVVTDNVRDFRGMAPVVESWGQGSS